MCTAIQADHIHTMNLASQEFFAIITPYPKTARTSEHLLKHQSHAEEPTFLKLYKVALRTFSLLFCYPLLHFPPVK